MAYNALNFGLLRTKVLDSEGLLSSQWMRWITNALIPAVNNSTPLPVPGPFADDTAAQAGGVPLQGLYYDSGGVPHVRIV